MSHLKVLKVWTALVISFGLSLGCYSRFRRERSYTPKGDALLYPPRIDGHAWIHLVRIVLFVSLVYDAQMFSLYLVRNLMLTGCFALLFLLLPALRKIMCAESCASLWLILCFALIVSGFSPSWSIPLPFLPPSKQLVTILFWIWLAGFATVMLWSILSHLLFRRHLLKESKPVTDETYIRLWQRQRDIANLPADRVDLRISPNTQTPLSIGLFARSTCLVLPERSYTEEELALIFQHELVHISREDSQMKFNMTFWAAFMWFNPLAWIALRLCAQDLELSCDEAVLYGRPAETRMKYAGLLLHTAARQQGFTSCLSASAASLRYRLKNVVAGSKRIAGSVIVGLLCFAVLLGSMSVGIEYRAMSVMELVFPDLDPGELEVVDMYARIEDADAYVTCSEDEILDHVGPIKMRQTTDRPDIFAESCILQLVIRAPGRVHQLIFAGDYLRVVTNTYDLPNSDPDSMKTVYYRLENRDWQRLIYRFTYR